MLIFTLALLLLFANIALIGISVYFLTNKEMNPFYTWPVYFAILQKWIGHFDPHESLDWPVSRQSQQDGLFRRWMIQSATELEMLEFYGCLDSRR